MDDLALVTRQLGREPRAFHRVVARCPFGAPTVTEQRPYSPEGEPFPTTYYLTCHHLVAAVSRLEAAGGVERWSAAVEEDEALRRSVDDATELQVEIRKALAEGAVGRDGGAALETGIAGSRSPHQLKCLHAHAAFALAHPGYALGEAILAELPDGLPERCCSLP